MKKIFLSFLIILNVLGCSLYAQQHCSKNINTISTDWRNPNSQNSWDWTTETFNNIYIKTGNNQLNQSIVFQLGFNYLLGAKSNTK